MSIEVVFEKRINNVAVHRGFDADQRRQYALLVGLAALFMVGLLFYGWQQYSWIQTGYHIESAQKKRDELTEYKKQLAVQRALYAQPARIDSIARNHLGMIAGVPGQTVMLSPDAPSTLPQQAVAPDAPLTATASKR